MHESRTIHFAFVVLRRALLRVAVTLRKVRYRSCSTRVHVYTRVCTSVCVTLHRPRAHWLSLETGQRCNVTFEKLNCQDPVAPTRFIVLFFFFFFFFHVSTFPYLLRSRVLHQIRTSNVNVTRIRKRIEPSRSTRTLKRWFTYSPSVALQVQCLYGCK